MTLSRNETKSLIQQMNWSKAPLCDMVQIWKRVLRVYKSSKPKRHKDYIVRTKQDLENSRCKAYKIIIK